MRLTAMHFPHRRAAGSAPTPANPPACPPVKPTPIAAYPFSPFSQGMIRARHFEAQDKQAWCVTLVTDAVITQLGPTGYRPLRVPDTLF